MIAWLIALPVVVAAFLGTRLLQRRGRAAVRLLVGADAALLVGALALLTVTLSGAPAQASGSQAAAQTSGSGSAALIGAAIAVAGASIGAAIAVAYTGAAALGGPERTARAVRTGDGHRRTRGGHRHLRPRRRDHPHREGVTVGRVAAIGERTRVSGLALAGVTVLVAEEPESVHRAWPTCRGMSPW